MFDIFLIVLLFLSLAHFMTIDVVVEFDPTSYAVNEDAGTAVVTVVKRTETERPVTVGFRTESGTATSTGVCVCVCVCTCIVVN